MGMQAIESCAHCDIFRDKPCECCKREFEYHVKTGSHEDCFNCDNIELCKEKEKVKMIKYSEIQVGYILRIVGAGAPGYAKNGDLVKVTEVKNNAVVVEDKNGRKADFVYDCGAARLEKTEWKNDFPAEERKDEINV